MTDTPVLGIDLGTTFSSMAIVERHGRPLVMPNGEGHPTTPSVIHFYDVDTYVVGDEAVKMVVIDPTNIVRFIKRSMGEADFTLEFFGRAYTPQELSAIILRKLKVDAEAYLGHPVTDAVITVPAYFNSAQRGATAEAGTIAGFNVLSIINEPTAAAIAYGIHRLGSDRRIMIFDLGGGTFDVTLMEIRGSSLKTIASDGNAELGGKDWDDRLLNHVAEQFHSRFGVDPRDEPQPFQELYERVLAAKISLTSQQRVIIPVSFRGHRLLVPVSREDFDGLCSDLVQQCAETCGLVLAKSGLGWKDVDEILPVGGASRMPMIRSMLETVCGKIRHAELNPDDCVAAGAALAAVYRHRPDHPARKAPAPGAAPVLRKAPPAPRAPSPLPSQDASPAPAGPSGLVFKPVDQPVEDEPDLVTEPALPDIQITDAATHPMGVIVLDIHNKERVVNLITESTPLPCEKRGRFAYAYDNMTTVRVMVTEGHGTTPEEVVVIGEVVLDRLPPRPRGTPIDVVYRYTRNQILEVDIIDVESGVFGRASIHLKGSLSEERIREAQRKLSSAQVF